MSKLVMFHGRECPHCRKMMPLVDKMIEEKGVEIGAVYWVKTRDMR